MPNIQPLSDDVDVLRALLWQYEGAPRLKSILDQKQAWWHENQTVFWENWNTDVFDLRTANNFGLSVWAIILDVPLIFEAPPSPTEKIGFGFGQYRKRFDQGNFKTYTEAGVKLTVAQKRLVLRLRAYQIVSSGSLTEINRFIKYLFESIDFPGVYCRDNLDMTITYVFPVDPGSELRLVLDEFDLLPRPCGVSASYEVTP
jgi:Protein of unknown function (DUF2612)